MAAVLYLLLPILLLTGRVFLQCFTSIGCTGSLVPAANLRECYAGTDSYNDGGTCSL